MGGGGGTGLNYPKKLFAWKEELKQNKKKRKKKRNCTPQNNEAN